MSEAENHPPVSSVTALRISIIKKGNYDLWCMKMRQYIAITDHILWDIITNGDQATTEPASSSGQPSAPKTSIVVNAKRNNKKALNILLSAIPDRHLLCFFFPAHGCSRWPGVVWLLKKARLRGIRNLEMQKKSLETTVWKTFVVGACLPFVGLVVATMIKGQPGLDELDFDDLYNNLKVILTKYADDNSDIISKDHVDLGQDGLGVFDWSEEADNAPVGNPEEELKDHAIIDSGCSRSMTGDKDKLSDFKDYKGGYVAFGNDPKGGRITGNGTIKTSCIDYKRSVSLCLILSPEFKIVDENLMLLRAPRKNDVYSLNLKSIIPSGGVTCLVAKASEDEAILWHRRLGHVNFKNINKLVKNNLVRGLPSKTFKHDHSCLAYRKGKQHKASCKKLEEKTVREPLELLHMDLFGPVSVASLNRKNESISIARTPQQNGVAERKNRTLIEAARTMLADSLLPIQFWAEAVHTACYVLNRMNQKGKGLDWMFDLDILTPSLNYIPFMVQALIWTKAVSIAITNGAHNKDSDESTVVKEVPLTIEDQDLQKEFENLMLQEIIAHTHMKNQGIASEKRKEKGKEIYDLSESDDDLPKDGIFDGNSFDDENKDSEEEIDLDLNNMDNTIDELKQENSCKVTTHIKGIVELYSKAKQNKSQRSEDMPSSRYRMYGCYVFYQMEKEYGTKWGLSETKELNREEVMLSTSRFCRSHIQIKSIRDRKDIMLVQVYVDDIIFGSTKTSMVKEFEELIQKEFKMSSMGEHPYPTPTYFLFGLQVKQCMLGFS
ncbi:putative ribonuclease H-like domain-containing protein [Tanacetum coccineum]